MEGRAEWKGRGDSDGSSSAHVDRPRAQAASFQEGNREDPEGIGSERDFIEEESLVVAELGRAHGLRGEIGARLFGLTPEELLAIPQIKLRRPDGSESVVHVRGARSKPAGIILEIEELTDRTDAEGARGASLIAAREHLPAPEPGEWYLADLVGCEVVTEDGEHVGTLEEVLNLPANDVYVVRGGEKELLLPATDEVIRNVDLESKRVTIRLLPGLADE
jgi:16S rRNA processing protein RimM